MISRTCRFSGTYVLSPAGVRQQAAENQRLFHLYYALPNHAPLAGLQVVQGDVPDLDANEAQGGEAYSRRHVAHLAVLALDERQPDPTGGNVGSIADGWHTLPKTVGRRGHLGLARLGAIALDNQSFLHLPQRFRRDLPVHLGKVGAWVRKLGVEQALDEPSVVGQEQGALAVVVEPTGGVHVGRKSELVEGAVAGFGRELAENAVRLVEQNDHDLN